MRPHFRILADSKDVSAVLRDRLLSLRLCDQAGILSDTVELTLDDRNAGLELPRKGAELIVFLGYVEQGLVQMGLYTVDEIELEGPPDKLTVRAKAADMRGSLKEHKTRPWDLKTLGDVVKTIAAEHSLECRISPALVGTPITHLDQTEESDMNFLLRLAARYDAVAKSAGGCLLFVARGEAKSATGKEIAAVILRRDQTTSHQATLADRGRFAAVRAFWHDRTSGERRPVLVGSGEPVYTLRHTFADADTAQSGATSKLRELNRGQGTISLSLPGNPFLAAEGKLTLCGFRTGIDGDWIATRVEHELSSGGYQTRVEAQAVESE